MSQIIDSEYVSAAALRAALRRFGNESNRVLREHGLTTERYELLLAIKVRSENSAQATIAQLAEDLYLAPSSMTQLARRAEDAGLLYRGVSREDARIHYLLLTDAGAGKLTAAASDLGPERQQLIKLLRKLDASQSESTAADSSSRLAQV